MIRDVTLLAPEAARPSPAVIKRALPLRELAGVTLSLVEDADAASGKVLAVHYRLDFGPAREPEVIGHEAQAHLAFEREAGLLNAGAPQ